MSQGRVRGPQQNQRQRVESEATIQKHVGAEKEDRDRDLDALRGPIDELAGDVDANNDGIIDNQESIGTLSGRIDGVNTGLGTFEQAPNKTQVRPYLKSLDAEIGTNNPRVGVKGRLMDLEQSVGVNGQPETLVERIYALEQQNQNQSGVIQDLKAEVDRLRGDVGDVGGDRSLNAQVNELQDFRNRSGGFANKVAQSGSNNHRHV